MCACVKHCSTDEAFLIVGFVFVFSLSSLQARQVV